MLSASVNPKQFEYSKADLAPDNLGYRIKLLSQLQSRVFQERLEPF